MEETEPTLLKQKKEKKSPLSRPSSVLKEQLAPIKINQNY